MKVLETVTMGIGGLLLATLGVSGILNSAIVADRDGTVGAPNLLDLASIATGTLLLVLFARRAFWLYFEARTKEPNSA